MTSGLLRCSNIQTQGASATNYVPAANTNGTAVSAEANRQVRFRTPGTIRNISILVTANDRGASSLTLRVNGASRALSAAIPASTTGIFTDDSVVEQISSGDLVDYAIVTGAGGTTFQFNVMNTIFTPASRRTVMIYARAGGVSESTASTTFFSVLAGNSNTSNSTSEADAQTQINQDGKIRSLQVRISANTRTDATTWVFRKNGADTPLTVSVPNATTGILEYLAEEVIVERNDLLNYAMTLGAGTGAINTQLVKVEFESAGDQITVCNGIIGGTPQNSGLTRYGAFGGHIDANATESLLQTKLLLGGSMSNLCVRISVNTLNGATTFVLRLNGQSASLSLSIPAGTTGFIEDTDNIATVDKNDLINYMYQTAGSTGTIVYRTISSLLTVRQDSIGRPPGVTLSTPGIY